MSTLILPFDFDGLEVRTTTENGEPIFCAKDVAEVLGYVRPSDAVNQHCKGAVIYRPLQTAGGEQMMRFIKEPDLYRLVMRSQLPAAESFEQWVVGEVIPQIRKTGGYNLPKTFPEALRLLADASEENDKLRLTVQAQAPAVEFVQKYVKATGLFGIRETAKILGLTQSAFVAMCEERRVLFRENGTLQPYAKWLEAEYFAIKTGEANEHAFKQTRFTSRGIEWARRYLNIGQLLGESTIEQAA
jgi:prophage antirepressor-like protein